ncbi:hypothetical protein ACFSRY_05290 [Pontibacter locisalis]|uniref:Uncharacterized protein n=1 Tax=Pontibacter locisalis TaxID=1719035 RepID=A0ABW5II36_9BACT
MIPELRRQWPTRALGVLTPVAKDWLATNFYELLSQARLKRLGRVLPETVFHRIALEAVRNFTSEGQALQWLDV